MKVGDLIPVIDDEVLIVLRDHSNNIITDVLGASDLKAYMNHTIGFISSDSCAFGPCIQLYMND